jgi:hypothetical protein
MIYLTGQQVLDAAMTLSTDQTATMRSKMAVWMGMVAVDISSRRKWNFLRATTTLTVASNAITLPNDYLEFVDMTFSNDGAYTFTETSTEMTFDPECPDGVTVDLTYIPSLSDMEDTATETVLPYYCKNALVFGILSFLFAFDNEDNYSQYPALFENAVKKLKDLDNRYNVIPTYDDIGFPVRTTVTVSGVV